MPAKIPSNLKRNVWFNPFSKPNGEQIFKKETALPDKPFLAKWEGNLTPTSLFGINLIAGNFSDSFDLQTKSLEKTQAFSHDYFGILAKKEKEGKTLVIMDGDWVLASLIKAFTQMEILNLTDDIMDKMEVYSFFDQEIGSIQKRKDVDRYESEILMIFLPVDETVAQEILTYLYSDFQYFGMDHYLGLIGVLKSKLEDFQYYYPVKIIMYKEWAAVLSQVLDREGMISAFYRNEVSRKYRTIDDLIGSYSSEIRGSLGAFATFLLAEATFYKFKYLWQGDTLILGDIGYIQALDLFDRFDKILSEIIGLNFKFLALSNFVAAQSVVNSTLSKCFWDNGLWWAAVQEIDLEKIKKIKGQKASGSFLETLGLTYKANDYPEEAKKIFTALGYSYIEEKDDLSLKIPLTYRTYKFKDEIVTEYFYVNRDLEVIIHISEGSKSDRLFDLLEKALNKGLFFSRLVKNLIASYPGFIPSNPTVSLNLSDKVEKAVEELEKML